MSDLQCPMTVVFCDPSCLGSARIRQIFDARAPSGVFACGSLALEPDALAPAGGGACLVTGLAEVVDVGSLRKAVEQLSDLHRGETIVVVAPTDLIQGALASSSLDPIVVAIDGDGWVVIDPRRSKQV